MSELRKDPVIGRWVIISPERGLRPHDFVFHEEASNSGSCPFCGGNEGKTPPEIFALRRGSSPNGPNWQVRVIPNKFPALRDVKNVFRTSLGVYEKMSGVGAHEVVVETPEHNKRIEMHTPESFQRVLEVYKRRLLELSDDGRFRYVIIFKNEGEKAGASLSHPHSQIIATPVVPKRVKEELDGAREYHRRNNRCVFCDIIRDEKAHKDRVVEENEDFIAFCPFASRFPFETWIMPREHSPDYHSLDGEGLHRLARILIGTMSRLSRVLEKPQYNFILHTGPVRYPREGYWTTLDRDWHWHLEIMPRITDVAGFEWGTGYYINPTAPEDAAGYLREAESKA